MTAIDSSGAPPTAFADNAHLGRNQWWRLFVGVAVVVVCWLGATIAAFAGFPEATQALSGALVGAPATTEARVAFALLHLSFGGGALGLILVLKGLHGRSVRSAITAAPRFRWGLMLGAAGVAIAASAALTPFTDARSAEAVGERLSRFSVADWLLLTGVYTTGVLIQAGWEEVLTRGWILQQVQRVARNPWIAVAASTLVFVAMHIGHPGWATYITAGLMGAAFGWSAIRLNGLEAAIGAHVANNLVAGLFAGAFLAGNPAELGAADLVGVALYLLAFVAFVEVWARRLPAEVPVRV